MNLTARLMVVAIALTTAACATRAPVYTPSADVTTPVVLTEKHPDYTEEAMAAKIQGSVLLDCVVLPDGTVGDVEVVRSLDSVLGLDTQAALALARHSPPAASATANKASQTSAARSVTPSGI